MLVVVERKMGEVRYSVFTNSIQCLNFFTVYFIHTGRGAVGAGAGSPPTNSGSAARTVAK
jgi:membrane associated rhomboid family serine protease